MFYFLAYKTRLLLYKLQLLKVERVSVPVISIGNITCGGTGKTPLAIETAKYLISKGYKVAVLSRGYRRKITDTNNRENILVSDGEELLAGPESSGDEPYLIAKNLPGVIVLSGANRIQTARSAIKLGAEVLILDDGFQYLKLHRNENIVILDGEKPFDNGSLLPAGELRELPDSIKRATAIVLSNTKGNNLDKVKEHLFNKPVVEMNYKIKSLKGLNIVKSIDPKELKNKKIMALSGIGNPQSFIKTLTNTGFYSIENLVYADHYNYEFEDITQIIDIAVKNKIEDIITTEKDAVKLEFFIEGAPVTFWQAVLEVTWNDNAPFNKLLSNFN